MRKFERSLGRKLHVSGVLAPPLRAVRLFWGGEPDGGRMGNRGRESWSALFGERKALNLGFGWDRTQNVLKRIELGELRRLHRVDARLPASERKGLRDVGGGAAGADSLRPGSARL